MVSGNLLFLFSIIITIIIFFIPINSSAISPENKQNITIPPVIVSAKEKNISLSSGPKTVITHQLIKDAGVTSLAQTLQSLANIPLTSVTGNESEMLINIRGFGANGSSNALLLVDGMPITNPDLAAPDLDLVPMDEIEAVEVVSGSESVLYGDQAVGGTINIVTNNKVNERPAFSCETGSFKQYGCLGTIPYYYQALNLLTSITLSTHHTDNYRAHNAYDEHRLFGRVNFNDLYHQLNFNYQLAYEKMQYPGALTGLEVSQNRQSASNTTDFFKDWHGFFHLTYQQFLSAHWKFKSDIAYRQMTGDGVLFSSFTQSRSSYFLKPQLQGVIGNTLITSGIDLQFDQYHLSSAFGLTDERQGKLSIFALSSMPIKPNFILSAGARGGELSSHLQTEDSTAHLNRAWATTLGLTYYLSTHTSFYLRRALSYRFPKADENAFSTGPLSGLRTEHGVSYETGIQINQPNYALKLNGYLLNLTDEIAFDSTKTERGPFGANRNLAPTMRRGFTLSGRYQVMRQLSVDGQYDFVDARFRNGPNANNRIPLVPEHIFHANIRYQINPSLHFYTGATYTGNQYAANDDQNIAGVVGGYMLYHLNVRYEHKPFSASFRINNIFNKYYYFYTVIQQSIKFFYPAPGRNFILTLNYEMS